MWDFIVNSLATIGGTGIIIIFIKWLLDVQKNRISSNENHQLSVKLEEFKSEISNKLNKQSTAFSLYFSGQFDIYNKLWSSIVELEEAVDLLWEDVDKTRFESFVKATKKAKRNVRKAAPYIENEHYQIIDSFFTKIDEYREGKQKILSYDNLSDDEFNGNLDVINGFVDQNRETRNAIHQFAETCLHDFREKLKGENETN